MFQCQLKSGYEMVTYWKWLLYVTFYEIKSCGVARSFYINARRNEEFCSLKHSFYFKKRHVFCCGQNELIWVRQGESPPPLPPPPPLASRLVYLGYLYHLTALRILILDRFSQNLTQDHHYENCDFLINTLTAL